MTTKDHCLLFKGKQIVVDQTLNDRFKDLNLNQNHISVEIFHSKDNTNDIRKGPRDFSKMNNSSQAKESSLSWGKFKRNCSSENHDIQYDSVKKEFEEGKVLNSKSSTLSLHIVAYENSIDATSDDPIDGKKDGSVKSKEKGLVKKFKNVKQLLEESSPTLNNLFEFPRQQQDQNTNPEVMQFKTSQRLSNTDASSSNTEIPQANNERSGVQVIQRFAAPRRNSPPRPLIGGRNASSNRAQHPQAFFERSGVIPPFTTTGLPPLRIMYGPPAEKRFRLTQLPPGKVLRPVLMVQSGARPVRAPGDTRPVLMVQSGTRPGMASVGTRPGIAPGDTRPVMMVQDGTRPVLAPGGTRPVMMVQSGTRSGMASVGTRPGIAPGDTRPVMMVQDGTRPVLAPGGTRPVMMVQSGTRSGMASVGTRPDIAPGDTRPVMMVQDGTRLVMAPGGRALHSNQPKQSIPNILHRVNPNLLQHRQQVFAPRISYPRPLSSAQLRFDLPPRNALQPLRPAVSNQSTSALTNPETSSLITRSSSDDLNIRLAPAKPLFLFRNHIGYKLLASGYTIEDVKLAVSLRTPNELSKTFRKGYEPDQRNENDGDIIYDLSELITENILPPILDFSPHESGENGNTRYCNQHAHKKGSSNFTCYFCRKVFRNLELLKFHLKTNYPSFIFTFSTTSIKVIIDKAPIQESNFGLDKTEILIKNRYVSPISNLNKRTTILPPPAFRPQVSADAEYFPGLCSDISAKEYRLQTVDNKFKSMKEKHELFMHLWNIFIVQNDYKYIGKKAMYDRLMAFITQNHDQIKKLELEAEWQIFLLTLKNVKGFLNEKQFFDICFYKTPLAKTWHGVDTPLENDADGEVSEEDDSEEETSDENDSEEEL